MKKNKVKQFEKQLNSLGCCKERSHKTNCCELKELDRINNIMTNKTSKKLKPNSLLLLNSSLLSLSPTTQGLCRCRIQSSLPTKQNHLTNRANTIQSTQLMKGQLINSRMYRPANAQKIQLKLLLAQTSHQIYRILYKLKIYLLKFKNLKNSKFQKNQVLRCSLKMY